jgi:hypothetical protein
LGEVELGWFGLDAGVVMECWGGHFGDGVDGWFGLRGMFGEFNPRSCLV